MTITVQLLDANGQPSGATRSFPDGTTQAEINAALARSGAGFMLPANIPTLPRGQTGVIGPTPVIQVGVIGSAFESVYAAGAEDGSPLTTGAPTANVLRALPFIPPRDCLFDRIGFRVTAQVAGNARLGVWQSSADPASIQPTKLLFDSGNLDTGTTGVKSAALPPAIIPAGTVLWLGIVTSASPTLVCLPLTGMWAALGYDVGMNAPRVGVSVPFTFGAFPTDFPLAGIAPLSASPIPALFLRAAA